MRKRLSSVMGVFAWMMIGMVGCYGPTQSIAHDGEVVGVRDSEVVSEGDSAPGTTAVAVDFAVALDFAVAVDFADGDPPKCGDSTEACNKCCVDMWGEGASGSWSDNVCTHCNVPQGTCDSENTCNAICLELNCETYSYHLTEHKCHCMRCPGK